MRNGTYRGTSDDLLFEIRLELDPDEKPVAVSGDVLQAGRFIGSFHSFAPERAGQRVSGDITFRGNSRLHTGFLTMEVDARGLGSFEIAVDLEGGHRDRIPGRLEWQGSFLRRIQIEVDGLAGQPFFSSYDSLHGQVMSLETAFARAGFDAEIRVDPFSAAPSAVALRGYTYAEIHRAMEESRNAQSETDRLRAHIFVCTYLAGRNGRGVLGVMYDFGADDLNRRPREGVAVFAQHPLFSDPRVPDAVRHREFVYTMVHETGHALNLLHSFDKGRPASLSWMNYPQLYPLGGEAGRNHNGSAEFWRAFPETFDDLELRHLRHATPREISAGGFPFGVYEEGPSSIYQGGTADPRRTALGYNPLRQSPYVELAARPMREEYQLGEPVFIELSARAVNGGSASIPDALDPTDGFTRITIQTPSGQLIRYQPPLRLCQRASRLMLRSRDGAKKSHAIPLFLSAQGPMFTEPGRYTVWAELTGIDGARAAFADPFTIRVAHPDVATARFAEAAWNNPRALEALYLKHPLTNREAWNELEEAARPIAKKRDNSSWSYLNYIAALGWLDQFARPARGVAQPNVGKALDRLEQVDSQSLPPSARGRATRLLEERRGAPERSIVMAAGKPMLRPEMPPSGLFGESGLDLPRANVTSNPFAIVVRTHEDNPAFADVVTWNIQHLHGTKRLGRIEKIANYMLGFRCDFWALQEVGEDGVRDLVEAMNTNGDLEYAYAIVRADEDEEATGQQSACVYRTDTVTLRKLSVPEDFFRNEVQVEYKDGSKKMRRVFLRDPLLCDVRVTQSTQKVFDFRCAVVHLKSTDPKIKDSGSGMRAAAAAEVGRWIDHEREEGAEQDFLIMGDMNAETAKQGLEPFASAEDLRLLSVGMKQKYGTGDEGAITRFASKRLLDHIVVTSDAVALMPASDLEEQIIIRSDLELEGFTNQLSGGPFAQYEYSDHIPVAVRFILGADTD